MYTASVLEVSLAHVLMLGQYMKQVRDDYIATKAKGSTGRNLKLILTPSWKINSRSRWEISSSVSRSFRVLTTL